MVQPARKQDGNNARPPRDDGPTAVDEGGATAKPQPRSAKAWLMFTLVFGVPMVLLVVLGMLSNRC